MSAALRSRAGVTCAAAAVLAVASPVVAYLESTVAYAGSGASSGSGEPPASGPEPVQEPSSLRWLFPERPTPDDVPALPVPEVLVPLPVLDAPAVTLVDVPAAVPAPLPPEDGRWTAVPAFLGAVAGGADVVVPPVKRSVEPADLLQTPIEELLALLAVDPGTPCYDELRRQVESGELVLTGLPTDRDALASVPECSTAVGAVVAPAGALLS